MGPSKSTSPCLCCVPSAEASGTKLAEPAIVEADGTFVIPDVTSDVWGLLVSLPSRENVRSYPTAVAVRVLELANVEESESTIGLIVLPQVQDSEIRTVDSRDVGLACRVAVSLDEAKQCVPIRYLHTDQDGRLSWPSAVRDALYVARVRAALAPWGDVEEVFHLTASDSPRKLRVTGDGYLIVRFWTSGPARERTAVRKAVVMWRGRRSSGSVAGTGREQGLGLWVGSGDFGSVHLTGEGLRESSASDVVIQRGRPTVVDMSVDLN
jgi:hypothetical protein